MLALLSSLALAGPWPDCGPDNLAACPPELSERRWDLISWIPAESVNTIRPAERDVGSGLGVDLAWRHTAGDPDVRIAVLDGGIRWSSRDAREAAWLNAGELPLPLGADGEPSADPNGDGRLGLDDWAHDPRVDASMGATGPTDVLDPSDLIAAFSDGVDDDGNGWPDDICGWDVYRWDNDPYASPVNTWTWHGTGVMEDAAAAAGDGGRLGVCPDCTVLPVRIGDAFITDGDRVAAGVTYAVDAGASVIAMAIGAMTHPEAAREALLYADAHGVLVVAAAGDENSWHHNAPAWEAPVLAVHAVRGDNLSGGGAYTYTAFRNCGNWGPWVDLVAPGDGCATAATGRTAGTIGLITAARRDAGLDADADQVRSLLRGTAYDVDLTPEELVLAGSYPSREGFDAWYGHGRVRAGAAVEAVVSGARDLPVARLDGPRWFSWVQPGGVAVEGHAEGSWSLELGRGAEPDTWEPVATGEGPVDGVLAELDLSAWSDTPWADLDDESLVERSARVHEDMVHVRLVSTRGDHRDEDHLGWWVATDPDLLPGFPFTVGSSVEAAPVLADLDGDRVLEVVVVGSGGTVHVLDGAGRERPGFPVSTDPIATLPAGTGWAAGELAVPREGVLASAAVGDLDGDGSPEVVVATLRGGVYAWHADGTPVSGFPVRVQGRDAVGYWDEGVAGAPTLVDVDGDGAYEVLVAAMDQRLYLWGGDGALREGWPVELRVADVARLMASPAVGDLDGDGRLEAVLGSQEVPDGASGWLWAVHLDTGEIVEGWPVPRPGMLGTMSMLPVVGEGHPSSVALADLDGDGDDEVATAAILGSLEVLDGDGTVLLAPAVSGEGDDASFDAGGSVLPIANYPACGDLDGDGTVDLALSGVSGGYLVSLALVTAVDYQQPVGAWSGSDGAPLPGFPRQIDDWSFFGGLAMADVSGDGRPELVAASAGHLAYAWDADGELAAGWPHATGGWALGGAAVGDIDGDGYVDAVLGTREGWVLAWRTRGRADQAIPWAAALHDARNTANHGTPLPEQAGPPEQEDEGCGCASGPGLGWVWLLLVPVVGRRRVR